MASVNYVSAPKPVEVDTRVRLLSGEFVRVRFRAARIVYMPEGVIPPWLRDFDVEELRVVGNDGEYTVNHLRQAEIKIGLLFCETAKEAILTGVGAFRPVPITAVEAK